MGETSAVVKSEKESAFELIQRKAMAYSKSDLLPKEYKNNVPNIIIAMGIAERMKLDIMTVTQSVYIVHGKPAWSSKFLIAGINSSKCFKSKVRYELNKDRTACRAYAIDHDGEVVYGPSVTMEMAKQEGWLGKNGSKWQTMPELMLMYRSAAFFSRVHAPEISLGLNTLDEIEDIEFSEVPNGAESEIESRLKLKSAKTKPIKESEPEKKSKKTEPDEKPPEELKTYLDLLDGIKYDAFVADHKNQSPRIIQAPYVTAAKHIKFDWEKAVPVFQKHGVKPGKHISSIPSNKKELMVDISWIATQLLQKGS